MGKRNRRAKIDRMMQKIESRGGIVGITGNAPDWLVEEFLQSVIDCPECQEEAERLDRLSTEH